MNRLPPVLIAFACVLTLTTAVAAVPSATGDGHPQAFTERTTGFFDHAVAAERQQLVHRWLTANRVEGGTTAGLEIPFPAKRMARIGQEVQRRYQVGLAEPVDLSVDLGRFGGFGAKRSTADGYVWSSSVRVPGATALRIYFESMVLPAGAELYLYNDLGQVRGPYTGAGPRARGSFWSHTLDSDHIHLQVHHRGVPAKGFALHPSFVISEVGVIGERFLKALMASTPDPLAKSFCSFNEPCVENASCSSIPGPVLDARDAAALYLFASGGGQFICSGGLLADTDTSTQIPYFLTANHCLRKKREADSVEAYFQFSTPCSGLCFNPQGSVPTVLGSAIMATGRASDFTLLRLDQAAPAGSTFLGWTSTPVAFSDGTDLFRISHPAGAPQAYSEHSVSTSRTTCGGLPRGDFIYSDDTFGATEGGSSGSPVLNGQGQVVGQLFGACGFNVGDPCDIDANATVDGAFAATFPSVAEFLDPGTGCTDNDNDGFCEEDDCDDFDPSVNPGAAEVCGDVIDNDCDGAVDEGCGPCLPKGASCTLDSECCSNKCKGPSGNKSCK